MSRAHTLAHTHTHVQTGDNIKFLIHSSVLYTKLFCIDIDHILKKKKKKIINQELFIDYYICKLLSSKMAQMRIF